MVVESNRFYVYKLVLALKVDDIHSLTAFMSFWVNWCANLSSRILTYITDGPSERAWIKIYYILKAAAASVEDEDEEESGDY
jgi:hypothetical protein